MWISLFFPPYKITPLGGSKADAVQLVSHVWLCDTMGSQWFWYPDFFHLTFQGSKFLYDHIFLNTDHFLNSYMTCLQWLYHNLNISYNIKFKTYMEKKKKDLH